MVTLPFGSQNRKCYVARVLSYDAQQKINRMRVNVLGAVDFSYSIINYNALEVICEQRKKKCWTPKNFNASMRIIQHYKLRLIYNVNMSILNQKTLN